MGRRAMLIRAGFEISYFCPAPTPMILMLHLRPERRRDLVLPEILKTRPILPLRHYRDSFGNICSRVTAPAGATAFSADFVIEDSGLPDEVAPGAVQHPIEELPDETLLFLLSSRYCETDRLSELAWSLFGGVAPGWARVQAIVDYVHARITFDYQRASPMKSAHDVHEERWGVCRDFAHLAIALTRCMNIPARYCTGYLGDIGIPPIDAPMDFSAWFEVWLGGAWRTFDARHNKPRIGRLPMAYGRDAADCALITNFGAADLTGFSVTTDELPAEARLASS
jgi:transglutaminase-like putative cysteine protease